MRVFSKSAITAMSTHVSVEEYRTLLGDESSTDEQIERRLRYIEALCRNVITLELEKLCKQ